MHGIAISIEDPSTPDIVALLEAHLQDMRDTSPPESIHALDVEALRKPHITFLAARDDKGALLGVGAIAQLDQAHGEVKSMRTHAEARGRGVAAAVLTQLLDIARERGYAWVSLETGAEDFFQPAHRLYERHGFARCGPFGSYVEDPHSRFYTLQLAAPSNPARLTWAGLPADVRAHIGELAGAQVAAAETATTGFSPGFAGVLDLADGRKVFVKAMSDADHPHSIWLNRREAHVVRALPADTPVAPLLWEHDADGWHLLGFEALPGPALGPASAADRAAAWELYSRVAAIDARGVVVDGAPLEPFEDALVDLFDRWARLLDAPDASRRLAVHGGHADWIADHADALKAGESSAAPHTRGTALVHADLRLDNMVRGADGRAVAVDWPWACIGAPWLDLLASSCAIAAQTGADARELFRSHPAAREASTDAERAMVCVIAGYFCHAGTEPEPPTLPGLRAFQLAQARPALAWLRALVD